MVYGWAKRTIRVKRVYELADAKEDGFRILVDRLWPRGLSKERARVDLWLKEIAPSEQLRKWFSHDPRRWTEFQRRYRKELAGKKELLSRVQQLEREKGTVTLIFSSQEERYNNAIALENALKSV